MESNIVEENQNSIIEETKQDEEDTPKNASLTIKANENLANPYSNINVKSLFKIPKVTSELITHKRVRWSLGGKELNLLATNYMKLIESEKDKIKSFTRLLILLNNDDWQHQNKLIPPSAPSILPSSAYIENQDSFKEKKDAFLDKENNRLFNDNEYKQFSKTDNRSAIKDLNSSNLMALSSPNFIHSNQFNLRTIEEDGPSEDPINTYEIEHEDDVYHNKLHIQNSHNTLANQESNNSHDPYLSIINDKLISMVQESLDYSNHYVHFLQQTYHALIKQDRANSRLFEQIKDISEDSRTNKE